MGKKQADPSLFTALINELPTRAAELLEVSAISTFNGSLKVTAYCLGPLSGRALNTEPTSWSGAREALEKDQLLFSTLNVQHGVRKQLGSVGINTGWERLIKWCRRRALKKKKKRQIFMGNLNLFA